MIKGVGIDIVENNRILKVIEKHEKSFLKKVLHSSELKNYNNISLQKSKVSYLASRWAVKEALVKAISNKSLIYSSIFIEKEINGKPFIMIDKHNFDYYNSPFKAYNNKEKEELENELVNNFNHINSIIEGINRNEVKLFCSISHEDNYSTAIVMYTENLKI